MSESGKGEFDFIRRIQPGCLIRSEGVVLGIGDDASAVGSPGSDLTLMTTDLMVEGIHFLRERISGRELGHKTLAVNLSDIAAMGGTPLDAYISLAVPPDCDAEYLDDLYEGMKALASRHDVNLLGGDTTRSRTDLVINVALRGSVLESRMLRRDGACPGDVLCCTGPLGDSRAGLENLLAGVDPQDEDVKTLRRAHVLPEPHVREGLFLSHHSCRAGIDVSDGLSSDVAHIAEASAVGIHIEADRLPVSKALESFCQEHGSKAWDYALNGGEDYVLLCTLSPEVFDVLAPVFQKRFGRPLSRIGEVTEGRGCSWTDPSGQTQPLRTGGWDHFKEAKHGE